MLLAKWWPIAGALVVAAGLATVGVGFGPGSKGALAQAAPAKPESELEALKKENELLKRNLQIVLEKLGLLEAELETLRDLKAGKPEPKPKTVLGVLVKPAEQPAKPAAPVKPIAPVKPAAPANPALLEKLAAEAAAAQERAAEAKAAEAEKAALLQKQAAEQAAKKADALLKAAEAERATLLERLAEVAAAKTKPAPAKDKLVRQLEELLKELRDSKDKDANENALKKLKELLAR